MLGLIESDYFANLHEIVVVNDGIWCASTGNDAIVKVDFNGHLSLLWQAEKEPGFTSWVTQAGLDSPNFSSEQPSPTEVPNRLRKRFHINTVSMEEQTVYGYDLRFSALYTVWPQFKRVVRNGGWRAAHNVTVNGSRIFVNNSAKQAFEIWRHPACGAPSLCLSVAAANHMENGLHSTGGWVRGMAVLGPADAIVGCSPASLLLIIGGHVESTWVLGRNPDECIHGLCVADAAAVH